jgi:hypothetical protein
MAEFSGGSAITAGFRLIGREPLAFLVWTLVYLVIGVLPAGWMLSEILQGFGPLMEAAKTGGEPRMDDMFAFQARMLRFQGLYYLAAIVSMTLLLSAVYRACLGTRPDGVFHLRLGTQELWLGLVILVLYVLMFIGMFVMMLPMFIVIGVMAATKSEALAWVAPLIMFVGFGVIVWAALRLSLAPIMSFQENTFRLFESWSVTRGHALKMFGVALALIVIIWIIELVLGAVAFGAVLGQLPAQGLADADPMQPFQALQRMGLGFWAAVAVGVALLGTFFNVLFGAAWAEIYRGLTPAVEPAAA